MNSRRVFVSAFILFCMIGALTHVHALEDDHVQTECDVCLSQHIFIDSAHTLVGLNPDFFVVEDNLGHKFVYSDVVLIRTQSRAPPVIL